MPEIIIHRGAQTIGGSCIEINASGSRIILDIGMPLMEKGGEEIDAEKLENPSVENKILPDVKGLYKDEIPEIDAVFISHAHIDHYGLLNYIHPSIPVYLSKGSRALLEIGRVFHPDQNKVFFDNFRIFDHWKPMDIGALKITSYLADHSAYDASSLLIEAGDKKIFYTGDFRGHGRKAKLLDRLIKDPIKDVDCMLMEGTTIGGGHQDGFEDETGVEKAMGEIFSNQKDVCFVMAAGSNIDRLVSLYRATKKCGKTLVLDLYTYYVLDRLKAFTPALPPHKGDHIRIFYIRNHAQNIVDHLEKEILYKYKYRKIEISEIADNRRDMVLKLPVSAMKRIANELITTKPLDEANFVFSMWPGYLEKDDYYYAFCRKFNTELAKVHVSGHAYLDALKDLAAAMKPKMLIPVHTLSGDDFSKHFNNVLRVEDSVPCSIYMW